MKNKVLLVALITGIVLILLAYQHVFGQWNQRLTDGLYGGQPASDSIKIIAVDDKSLHDVGRWPWDRNVYADILQHTRAAKVVAFDVAFFEPTEHDAVAADAMKTAGNVIIAEEYDFAHKRFLSPAPAFADIKTGIVNIYTDADGTSRSIPLFVEDKRSLAYEIANAFVGREPSIPDAKLLVNFVGPPQSYALFSAADVIAGNVDDAAFADAIVFIGATAPDLHDDYIVPTSYGKRMPGVEIHAHAVQTVLTKQYLSQQGFISLAVVILLFALLAGFLYASLQMRYATVALTLLLFAYVIFAIFIFKRGTILNLVYPPITIIATSLTTMAYIASHESKHKKYILGVFGKYVSKDVVAHLLEHKEAIELGGEEKDVTAMFADIRGFTAMSEKMKPHEVINVLNHYFGDMTDLVFKHDGTLDKFIGDCLFALWGTPLEDKDHALKAVKCCLDIQKKLKTKHTKNIPSISLGMGLCSGPAVVGNMGSTQRQEFTAIGDTINTASRLSGKATGGQIIISESTYTLVKDKVKVKKLAPVTVKGKEKPLVIYQVVSLKK